MRTREGFLVLLAELDGDDSEIRRILPQNIRAQERIRAGATDPLDWGALAFTIHTLYGVAENYFLRVSKFFENGLPSDRWHRALLEKMLLDVPGLRPPFFTDRSQFNDALMLLKFRHRIRNLYGEDLDPGKTAIVQEAATRFFSSFGSLHSDFRAKISAIAVIL